MLIPLDILCIFNWFRIHLTKRFHIKNLVYFWKFLLLKIPIGSMFYKTFFSFDHVLQILLHWKKIYKKGLFLCFNCNVCNSFSSLINDMQAWVHLHSFLPRTTRQPSTCSCIDCCSIPFSASVASSRRTGKVVDLSHWLFDRRWHVFHTTCAT